MESATFRLVAQCLQTTEPPRAPYLVWGTLSKSSNLWVGCFKWISIGRKLFHRIWTGHTEECFVRWPPQWTSWQISVYQIPKNKTTAPVNTSFPISLLQRQKEREEGNKIRSKVKQRNKWREKELSPGLQSRRLSVQGCVNSHSDPRHSLSALFAKGKRITTKH